MKTVGNTENKEWKDKGWTVMCLLVSKWSGNRALRIDSKAGRLVRKTRVGRKDDALVNRKLGKHRSRQNAEQS